PISSTSSTPRAIAIRRRVPNRLIASGMVPRVGRSNSSAGPPARTVRVTISVISRSGSTGTRTRCSSPARSRARRNSGRSRYGKDGPPIPASVPSAVGGGRGARPIAGVDGTNGAAVPESGRGHPTAGDDGAEAPRTAGRRGHRRVTARHRWAGDAGPWWTGGAVDNCRCCGQPPVRSPPATRVPGMPSSLHEALVHMFRHRPELAAELLTEAFGLSLPEYGGAALGSGDLSPVEFRADAVVVLSADNRPVLAVVVEAQLRRDTRKRWSWPVYLTTLRARLRCPAVLLVVCPDARTAAWCASPIELSRGATMTPLVLGPREVPVVTDPARAGRCPELAVLSAMAHGLHPEREKIFVAMLEALRSVDAAHATRYHDLVFAALPAVARHHLEKLMTTTYEYQSDFVRK